MIEFHDVSFRYRDSEAGLEGVNLSIREGECVVVTGPSGGGKTTLTRLINGLAPAHYPGELAGSIVLDGRSLADRPVYDIGSVVGSVFQDPKSQFFSSELAGEVAFACENYGMPAAEIRRRTDAAIAKFGLDGLRARDLDVLSSGEKQRVAIASVAALGPRVYVCDEPTANLDDEGARQLAGTLRSLKESGATLVIAEHRLAWLAELADRYVYVSGGRLRWEKSAQEMSEMTESERRRWGLRDVRDAVLEDVLQSDANDAALLSAHGVGLSRRGTPIFEGQTMAVGSGRVTALMGQNGAGKTSLALVLSGLWKESAGEVRLRGAKASRAARRRAVWFGSNDTGAQFFTDSVTEELLLRGERTPERLDRARGLLKRFGLYEFKDAHPASLSGGQKQRLSIACGVLSDREILILDEPTSGLDGGNMGVIAEVLRDEAARGKAILVITHDRELVRRCCDRVFRLDG